MKQSTKSQWNMRSGTIIFLGIVILVTLYLFFKPDDIPKKAQIDAQITESKDSRGNKMSLGQVLAYIELKDELPFEDRYVVKLDELLADLSLKYDEPIDTIANITSQCLQVLRENSVHETTEEFMTYIYNTKKLENTKYKDIVMLLAYAQSKAGRK